MEKIEAKKKEKLLGGEGGQSGGMEKGKYYSKTRHGKVQGLWFLGKKQKEGGGKGRRQDNKTKKTPTKAAPKKGEKKCRGRKTLKPEGESRQLHVKHHSKTRGLPELGKRENSKRS